VSLGHRRERLRKYSGASGMICFVLVLGVLFFCLVWILYVFFFLRHALSLLSSGKLLRQEKDQQLGDHPSVFPAYLKESFRGVVFRFCE
jgi:hypothetical protein